MPKRFLQTKAYRAPRVITYGKAVHLTASGTDPGNEGTQNPEKTPQP